MATVLGGKGLKYTPIVRSKQLSSIDFQSTKVQCRAQVSALSSRISSMASQFQSVQTTVNAVSSAHRVTRCRLCFREIEGSSQCQRSRHSCSGWSTSPSWTSPFRDDTDRRGGGCTYQWRLECAWPCMTLNLHRGHSRSLGVSVGIAGSWGVNPHPS